MLGRWTSNPGPMIRAAKVNRVWFLGGEVPRYACVCGFVDFESKPKWVPVHSGCGGSEKVL